jgi:hypothetical protein
MAEETTQTQNQSGTSQTRPLLEQLQYLQDAWSRAQGTYGQTQGNQYNGDLIARLTNEQANNFRGMYDFANNGGLANSNYSGDVASGAQRVAGNLAGTGAGFTGTANGLYDLGRGLVGSGTDLTNRGAGSAFDTVGALRNYATTGGVGTNISEAARYADNPYLSGQVDAAMRDARRQVSEQALPQIARDAALTGNIGSSKRGLAEGVVQRGLAEKTADVSAGLRGDAYNQGLNLAEQGRQFNNSAILDALRSSGSLAGSLAGLGIGQTGAGTSLINSGTGAGTLGLGFNNASQDATRLGLDANNQQLAQRLGLFGLANDAGAGMQAGNQLALDADRSRTEYSNQNAWDDLARYYSIIGSNNWGGTTNSTQTGTVNQTREASPFTIAGGLLGGATGLFGSNGLNVLGSAGNYLSRSLFG